MSLRLPEAAAPPSHEEPEVAPAAPAEVELTIQSTPKAVQVFLGGKKIGIDFQRGCGYAEQQDIHEPMCSVREALRFSAYLRAIPSALITDTLAALTGAAVALDDAPGTAA